MKKLFAVMALILVALTFALPVIAATATVTVKGNVATGSWTADAAATNVSIGWTPSYVIVTSVTNTYITAEWQTGMAANSCLMSKATGTTATETTAAIVSLPTVSCISTYAGSTSAGPGFTMGADTTINVTGRTLRFRAFR